MIRTHLDITRYDGTVTTIYPPLQWNECISLRKILADCRTWLHDHQPEWCAATVNLRHHNYTETTFIERGTIE